MTQQCIACGMPMEKPEDHAGGDVRKDYCLHCARPDGSMQSYEEKLESLARFLRRSEGLSKEAAREEAGKRMAKLPAWRKSE